jgi:16S rRNA (guanine527-N7)-methyltransferase
MTEEEARDWLVSTFAVSRETWTLLEQFVAMVAAENERQNLVSRGSLPHLWQRHVADSAQLLLHAPGPGQSWLDLGSGPGFPGIVLAILHDGPVHLVEARKGRVAFLERAAADLGLSNIAVHGCKLEALRLAPVNVITARAFAPLARLFPLAHSFSTESTVWVLPKGQSARSELESVAGTWQGMFHVKQSVTDGQAEILVASGVRRAGKR